MAVQPANRVAKIIGSDTEVANFIEGANTVGVTGRVASQLLVGEIPGVMRRSGYHAQDSHRKFLPSNGGCVYIDLDHGEFPTPEVLSAKQFVCAWHAMLRIGCQAMLDVNERLDGKGTLRVLINNSDGLGHSYGGHLSVLITRRAFNNIFHRKLHHLLYLAAYQVSSIVFTGQGKVGSENGAPATDYQISQRADFFETISGLQTTHRRPLVNKRDEGLCGTAIGPCTLDDQLARLHNIFYDSGLCHVGNYLKAGVFQIITAMIEAEFVNSSLILDDPVNGVRQWSHDPSLRRRIKLADGRWLSAVDHQRYFFDEAERFIERGGCEDIVPDAKDILETWGDVLQKLSARDFDSLAGSLDWVLKRRAIERAMAMQPDLNWDAPAIKHLDHLYSSLDPAQGLYWAYERQGDVQRLVSSGEIERFVHHPPEDTRAWARAMLLRQAGAGRVDFVDWDRIVFKVPARFGWPTYHTLWMTDPRRFTKSEVGHLFESELEIEELVQVFNDSQKEDTSSEDAHAEKEAGEQLTGQGAGAVRGSDVQDSKS